MRVCPPNNLLEAQIKETRCWTKFRMRKLVWHLPQALYDKACAWNVAVSSDLHGLQLNLCL